MANNKKKKNYTVKDCTPFSQDVNDDVLKKLSEYFEKLLKVAMMTTIKLFHCRQCFTLMKRGNLWFMEDQPDGTLSITMEVEQTHVWPHVLEQGFPGIEVETEKK